MRPLCYLANIAVAAFDLARMDKATELCTDFLEEHDQWYRDEPPALAGWVMGADWLLIVISIDIALAIFTLFLILVGYTLLGAVMEALISVHMIYLVRRTK